MEEWDYFTPLEQHLYKINVFDDGNQPYETYENKWIIYGKWRGKRALINYKNPSLKITSISKWKIQRLTLL
jgi:hypothetical protein